VYADKERRARTEKSRHDRYRSQGVCPRDGLPLKPGCKYCVRCLDTAREAMQRRRRAVIDRYGGACVCCGETSIGFLGIDHVNGDGAEHRKSVPGNQIYTWLRVNGFPPGFQVLCHNCNWYKRTGAECTCPYRGGLRSK